MRVFKQLHFAEDPCLSPGEPADVSDSRRQASEVGIPAVLATKVTWFLQIEDTI